MDANLYRIIYEVENNIQWIATSTYNYSFYEFTQSNDTPYNLALAFLANYERPADPNQPARGTQAQYWYEYLGGLPPLPTVTRKRKKFPWAVLTNKIRKQRTFFKNVRCLLTKFNFYAYILIDTNEKGETKMDILQLLGSYCFPIVACLGMGWYVKYITDKNMEETSTLNAQHTKVMLAYKDELKDAINNNTLVMQRLCDTMELKNTRTKKSKKGEEEKENEA